MFGICQKDSFLTILPVLLAFLTADHGNCADNGVLSDMVAVEAPVQSWDRY